jgi:dihydrofolate synthase/folylpolyglutamate synthase
MNYQQTTDYLFSRLPAYHRIGKAAYKNNLRNTLALDDYFGHPHLNYKTVHIAGTNGKGSVSHMIASVLQEAGYRTGLYTSPHLKDFRERIRVNGRTILKSEVIAFVRKHRKIIEALNPSFFEITVAMAFDHFRKKEVDIAVIEVGLGGRLDSTNIITPVISVITNIGHDHMDLLGDSLRKVAIEKAGIIKKGIPVVIGESQKNICHVFKDKATDTGSEISFADKCFMCTMEDIYSGKPEWKYSVLNMQNKTLTEGSSPLGGNYQAKNIQTVFMVCHSFRRGLKVAEKNILDGIARVHTNTGLKGRWHILRKRPLTICDTGHNLEGLSYNLLQLKRIPSTGLHIVIGFVADKDLNKILPLFPADAKYYFTRASVPRALDEQILQAKATEYGLKGNSYSTVAQAYKDAGLNAGPEDLIFIGGSTFVVAELI